VNRLPGIGDQRVLHVPGASLLGTGDVIDGGLWLGQRSFLTHTSRQTDWMPDSTLQSRVLSIRGEPVSQEVLMASSVNFGRVGKRLLPLVLVWVMAGCGSTEEVSTPPPSSPPSSAITGTAEAAGVEVDEFGIVDMSSIVDGFFPEITESDIEVIEDETGVSYLYVFPTRELSDGVTVDLQARWVRSMTAYNRASSGA
jgi:hypothetical protein